MSSNKQPIELVIANGKKHLTKEEIEQRRNEEVKPNTDNIVAPDHLLKAQAERFDYLAEQLIYAKIMTNLDVENLARYVVLEQQYAKVSKKINSTDIMSTEYDKLLAKQSKVFIMLDKLSNQLCLNILARCKVVAPANEEKKKLNKFEKFGLENG